MPLQDSLGLFSGAAVGTAALASLMYMVKRIPNSAEKNSGKLNKSMLDVLAPLPTKKPAAEPQENEGKVWTSWSGNRKFGFNAFHKSISSEAQLCDAVRKATAVRVVGTGRSSMPIVAGTTTLINLQSKYNQVVHVNKETMEVTVQAGATLATLLECMAEHGWGLPCLPDIDAVTIGGALATGTHGTAGGKGGLPLHSFMTAARVVLADGSIWEASDAKDGAKIDALRCSLGVLGILSTATFRGQPLYTLSLLERPLNDDEWLPRLDEMREEYDFLRFLWLPHTNSAYAITGKKVSQGTKVEKDEPIWYLKHRRRVSDTLYKAAVAVPALTALANKLLKQVFFSHTQHKAGNLYDATVTKARPNSSILELAEWSVPYAVFPKAFAEIKEAMDSLSNPAFAHIPMDVRFLRRDSAWLSTACQEDVVTIGCITRVASNADNYAAFKVVEDIFTKYGGRPHWAKRNTWKHKDFQRAYPKFGEFCALRRQLDPTGKFLNEYFTGIFEDKAL